MDTNKLDELLQRIEAKQLKPGDYDLIERLHGSYTRLLDSLKDENTTMNQLRELLASANTEERKAVTHSETEAETPPEPVDDDGTESS